MLEKVSKGITGALMAFCGVTVVGLTVIVALQVITRLMNISLPWTEELARFFLIWLTFLGCSLALQQDSHLSVDYFVRLAPVKARIAIGVFTRLLMIFFFGVLLVYGLKLSALSMATLSSSLQWPMGVVYVVMPVSGLISIFYVIVNTLNFVKVEKEEKA